MAGDDEKDLLSASAKGASYLVLLQFISRMLTFTLNQAVLKLVTVETLGIASVNLELLASTILFLSREGFRAALIRSNKSQQTVLNLAYIPTCFGLITTLIACSYYMSTITNETPIDPTLYRVSIVLYGLASFLELLVEPLFILASNQLYVQLRVRVEGSAVILRCLVTFGVLYSGQNGKQGILAFAIAQLIYGLTLMLGYAGFFIYKQKSINKLLPHKISEDGSSYWFDKPLLNLGMTMTKQSFLKHILTEGDKMLISVLSTLKDSGAYAVVVNYGSLIARILFQPLEEMGRTFFSKLLLSDDDEEQKKKNEKTAANVLVLLLRFHILLGLVFSCFATNYTSTLIDLLLGRQWSTGEPNVPNVLAMYCGYVPFMGVNGITESFVQAVATKQDLSRLSYFMIVFSVCFMTAGVVFMHYFKLGAIGLILANMVNLGIRICYSWYFITNYFNVPISIRQWFPHPVTVLAFVSSWFITNWSSSYFGWYTLNQKMQHIFVGGVTFLGVCVIMYWKEKDFISSLKRLKQRKVE